MAACDVLVVGAGFAGAVIAERLAAAHGLSVCVVERRPHLGGNAHDAPDHSGVRIHSYGPHWFRTRSPKVRDYLSAFTDWSPQAYRALSFVAGKYYSFPINLTTYEQLVGRPATSEEMLADLARRREPGSHAPKTAEQALLAAVGREWYEMFYAGYTRKQWGMDASELDASLAARIPVRTVRDERYVSDDFQALPADGYTRMFERMLASPRIRVMVGADDRAARAQIEHRHLVYTGMIDEYFDFRLGRLPYRSLAFERDTVDQQWFQPAAQVNYPGHEPFTRIIEYKHVAPEALAASPTTTIVREYSRAHTPDREAYYPMPTAEARNLYAQYAELAAAEPHVTFAGRLATYRYWNMDQIVAHALVEGDRLGQRLRESTPA